MPPKSECQPQHKPEIPEDFLESCMTNDEDRFVSEEKIVESITQDMPDLGNELNLMIGQYVANLVDKYIMEQVEDYADDYYEPSAREEAMADLRREFYESYQFATE